MIFAVIAADNPVALGTAIPKTYPSDYFKVAEGQWLVVDKGTAQEVSNKLGITDGANGGALVVAVSGYYGRKAANLWEWIKVKMSQVAT
ncbi:MAG: hypothetical protein ACHQ9S_27520 [Candidatus Binatia bacterium]